MRFMVVLHFSCVLHYNVLGLASVMLEFQLNPSRFEGVTYTTALLLS